MKLRSKIPNGRAGKLVKVPDEPLILKPEPDEQVEGQKEGEALAKIPHGSVIIGELLAVNSDDHEPDHTFSKALTGKAFQQREIHPEKNKGRNDNVKR